eukprot:15169488-Alexandrium_andersonii.AAC.1
MSASLVGSEMCIRDRRSRLPQAAPSHVSTHTSNACGNKSFCLCRPPAPVSYTHLTLPTICSV